MTLNATLPGATFGKASCTMKFKIAPQEQWTRQWAPRKRPGPPASRWCG